MTYDRKVQCVLGLLISTIAAGCSHHAGRTSTSSQPARGGRSGRVAGVTLLPSLTMQTRGNSTLHSDCRRTARALGFPVMCPTLLPKGSRASTASPACPAAYVDLFIHPGCTGSRIALLSIEWPTSQRVGHFVMISLPHVLPPLRAVTAPVDPTPDDRVRTIGRVMIPGYQARWLLIPSAPSSALSHHLTLYLTRGSRTYLVGFHGLDPGARALDLEVARTAILSRP